MSEIPDNIVCLNIIAGLKQKDSLLEAVTSTGGRLVSVEYGRGSAKVNIIQDMFGFVPEEKKVMISCLMKKENSDEMIRILTDDFGFNNANTGIAYTIPVEKLSF